MYKEKKIHQHYVSKFHLRKWQTSGSGRNPTLWTYNKDNDKIFPITDLNGVGQVSSFYGVFIDQDILDMLEYLYAERMEHRFVSMMMEQLRVLRAVNDYRERRLHKHERLDVVENNFLENQYELIETKVGGTIDDIVKAADNLKAHLRSNVLEKYLDLLGFFYIQYARTFAVRKALLAHVGSMSLVRNSGEVKLDDQQVEVVVKIMLFIDAMRNASEAQCANTAITIGLNNSGMDFVTSSAPAILQSRIVDGATHIDGFVALSPTLGMYVSRNATTRRTLNVRSLGTQAEVLNLNRITLLSSDRDVYSTSEEQLRLLVTSNSDLRDRLAAGTVW